MENWTELFDAERAHIADADREKMARRLRRGLIIAEVNTDALANDLCAQAAAQDDWQGEDAQDMATLARLGHQMRALHWEYAVLAAKRLGWDIPPNEGDR